MVKSSIQKILSIILVLALVAGCFAALPWTANAASAPVAGNPAWDTSYGENALVLKPSSGPAADILNNPRTNASGDDKITSNAHSADFPGLYFYWNDKQKDNGVLLVNGDVFDLFEGRSFVLTAKNSNNYWGYTISPDPKAIVKEATKTEPAVYAFGIPKQIQYLDSKGKAQTEDLKNINMVFIDGKYNSASFTINKVWYTEEGCTITDATKITELNNLLSLKDGKDSKISYKLGNNVVPITDFKTASKGKSITVIETIPAGYFEQDGKSAQTITVKCTDKPDQVVTFNNQKKWAEIKIEKIWQNADGNVISGDGLVALFKIAKTNWREVAPGKYNVKEGTYTVSEIFCSEGYQLVGGNNKEVTVNAGETKIVAFTNKDPTPPYQLTLYKTVEGEIFAKWSETLPPDVLNAILDDMTFELYPAELTPAERLLDRAIGVGTANSAGHIVFLDLTTRMPINPPAGMYTVEEKLGVYAARFFEQSDSLEIYIGNNGIVLKDPFDYDALYTIVNGYGQDPVNDRLGLGYPGLDGSGNIFYIGVTNVDTNVEYPSFCAHAGSERFAGDNGGQTDCIHYVVFGNSLSAVRVEDVNIGVFLSAFNYIEDVYGNVNEKRAITQTVVWALLDDVDVTSTEFAAITKLTQDEKDAVCDVLENHANYVSKGKIVDLVYMVCEGHENHDFQYCQPQLVPIYGRTFDNRLREPSTGRLSFVKTANGQLIVDYLFEHFSEDDAKAILDDVTFSLYSVAPDGTYTLIDTVGINPVTCKVDFGVLPVGEYVIVENLGSIAEKVFKQQDELTITVTTTSVSGLEIYFDCNALYLIDCAYITTWDYLLYGDYSYEIFYIGVTNAKTADHYASFCAYGSSETFAGLYDDCEGYNVVESATDYLENYDEFISALNYINDKFGDLNTNRRITQTVIWTLLGEISIPSAEWDAVYDLTPEEKVAVEAVIANLDYTGEGKIVGLVYMVCENHEHDAKHCQPQIVPVYDYQFDNQPKNEPEFGSFSFTKVFKTDDGKIVTNPELLAGINFVLYTEDQYMRRDTVLVSELIKALPPSPDSDVFTFKDVPVDTYWLVEILPSDALNPDGTLVREGVRITVEKHGVTDFNGIIFGSTATFIFGPDFDYAALYTIGNGYGNGYQLGYSGLNNDGDIFPITVINTETGVSYPSFCANAGSVSFDEGFGKYVVAPDSVLLPTTRDGITYSDFVKAYNYIEDNYGKLDDNRALTQIITWYLLGAIDIPSEKFDNINWDTVENGEKLIAGIPDAKDKVLAVVENYKDYSGTGNIVNVVFLISQTNNDYHTAQPQLVPIYGLVYTNYITSDVCNHVGETYEEVITVATCTEAGVMGIYCSDCDALLGTEEIAMLVHAVTDTKVSAVYDESNKPYKLTITVVETYQDGCENKIVESFDFGSKLGGTTTQYTVGDYTVSIVVSNNGKDVKATIV